MHGKCSCKVRHTDSICGCSIDEVHREMETRFAKVNQVGNFVKTNLNEWKHKIATQEAQSDHLFTVVNTALHNKVDTVSVVVDVVLVISRNCIRLKATRRWQPDLARLSRWRFGWSCHWSQDWRLGSKFGYTLPKDKFREPYIARQCAWQSQFTLALFLGQSFQLVEGQVNHRDGIYSKWSHWHTIRNCECRPRNYSLR